jgi:predicted RNA-binding protein with PUA-like domain
MANWLFKSEPESYSFSDLLAEPDRSTGWDGVRNYQARNLLRDTIRVGDRVLFYHSSTDLLGIAGIAKVTRAGHPDPSAFDPKSHYYDPKSDPEHPTWYQVSIQAVAEVEPPLGLHELKALPALAGMELFRKGNRLSVQSVSAAEWAVIQRLIKSRRRK